MYWLYLQVCRYTVLHIHFTHRYIHTCAHTLTPHTQTNTKRQKNPSIAIVRTKLYKPSETAQPLRVPATLAEDPDLDPPTW